MKKQKEKKAKTKKEDKLETSAEPSKAEEEPETTPETAPPPNDETEDPEAGDTKDAQETVSELSTASHGRQPSLSLQSKMRSSSFRQSSGGPLSPGYGFSPDGETAPDIFRKQALKIEELEKENKRLAKEASDGEKRWKKAEEELEDLREAEDDSSKTKAASSTSRSSGELEKLV
jgi:type IV secretory pathway VirB10-like protein